MKSLLTTLALGLVLGLMVTHASSQGTGEEADTVDTQALARQVEFLMVDYEYDESDIRALSQRVENAENVYRRIKAIYDAAGPNASSESMYRCQAEWQLARAQLDMAKQNWSEVLTGYDKALTAAKACSEVLQAKVATGSVTVDLLLSAENLWLDIQLERSRAQRRIRLLSKTNSD